MHNKKTAFTKFSRTHADFSFVPFCSKKVGIIKKCNSLQAGCSG